jgi:predicted transporter
MQRIKWIAHNVPCAVLLTNFALKRTLLDRSEINLAGVNIDYAVCTIFCAEVFLGIANLDSSSSSRRQ